jgi:hypothetical protein
LDLSFARLRPLEATPVPIDLAVLLVGVTARQAASDTARAQARSALVSGATLGWLRPESGAFSGAMAATLTGWKAE